jgi:hypothetical protein
MKSLIALLAVTLAPYALAQTPPTCPPKDRQRTAEQVLASHFANLAAGNYEAERCNYADNAVVISDGGVTQGVDGIVAALAGFGSLFGGQVPTVTEQVVVSILDPRTTMVRILFSISTPCVDIPDGTDTYIVRSGRIQAQTAHGVPVFKCGPPPGP